jgi:hypothetical protein
MAYIAQYIKWHHKVGTGKLSNGVIWLGTINASSLTHITPEHSKVLLECYIDRQQLVDLAKSNGRTPADMFKNEILPNAPHMKSGDFGEILCRSTLQEWRDCPTFALCRWRGRSKQNDTVTGPDLIGYVLNGNPPSADDVLILCEIKTRSSNIDKKVVRKAFDGVEKDFITRLTNSLYFYQILLRKDGRNDEALHYARFSNSYNAPYKKRLVACVVHDKTNWDDTFLQELPDQHNLPADMEVVILCIDNLADWIDVVHQSAVASAPI